MPPLRAAADAFLVLEYLAGNRRIPHPVFSALLAALPPVTPHNSPRLRKALALRALDLALSHSHSHSHSDSDAQASVLLRNARAVLAEPDLAPCFPDHLALCDDVVALNRLVDAEWASLPASALEVAADRIVGARAPNTDQDTRTRLHLLGSVNAVGESNERDILGKRSTDPQIDKAANAPSTSGGVNDAADRAQQDDEAHLGREDGRADRVQEDCDCAPTQQDPVVERTIDARLPEKSVTSATSKGKDKATSSHVTAEIAPDNNKSHPVKGGSNPSLMERNATASVYEWDDSGDSDHGRPPRKRQLPTFERKPRPPRPPHAFRPKTRRRWTEMEEKTLLEGVEKYGKGNWRDIKMAYPLVFAERSTVDLKDKVRNMERYR